MKKLFSIILAVMFVTSSLVFFTGCEDEPKVGAEYVAGSPLTYISVHMMGGVEMIVDENDKIATITGIDNDGDMAISSTDFRGYNVADAVQLIVQNWVESGLVELDYVGGNGLFVTIINPNIEYETKLRYEIKEKVQTYFSQNAIYGAVVDTAYHKDINSVSNQLDIEKDDLRLMLKAMEYDIHLELDDVRDKTTAELIELVAGQMKGVAKIWTFAKKQEYYEMLYAARDDYEDNLEQKFVESDEVNGPAYKVLREELAALEEAYWDEDSRSAYELILEDIYLKLEEVETLKDYFILNFPGYARNEKSLYEAQIDYINNLYMVDDPQLKGQLAVSMQLNKQFYEEDFQAYYDLYNYDLFNVGYVEWRTYKELNSHIFIAELGTQKTDCENDVRASVQHAMYKLNPYHKSSSGGFSDSDGATTRF